MWMLGFLSESSPCSRRSRVSARACLPCVTERRCASLDKTTDLATRILNTGSPYNVPAGHGGADLSTLIAKYEKESYEQNEKLMQQLKENKVPVEQPYKGFSKSTPAAVDS